MLLRIVHVRSLSIHMVLAAAVAGLLMLAGCSKPMQTISFYTPQSGQDLRVGASDGPANEAIINLPSPEVRLMVIAQPSYSPPRIWVSLHLPQGNTLRVVGDHFTLTPRDGSPVRTEKVNPIQGTFIVDGEGIYKYFQIGQELVGASTLSTTHFWGKHTIVPRHFEITASLGTDLPAAFSLTLPELQLNGKPLHVAPIQFTRATGQIPIPEDNNRHPW